ncbi:hypothetical protein Ancab_018031 [Ancistrocladus abbreviatus]
MAVPDGDMKEGSVPSLLLDSLKSLQSGDPLSPEDIAWADSCLIKDLEASGSDWNSLSDALLEILGLQPQPCGSSHVEGGGYLRAIDNEILPSSEELETTGYSGGTGEGDDSVDEDEMDIQIMLNSDDELLPSNVKDEAKTKRQLVNPFRPNYSDDIKEIENVDVGLELGLPACEVGSSSGEIFKVWELGIFNEEDEFSKQLNDALAGSSSQPIQPNSDDSLEWKGLINASVVDDLIAGIADLSFNQNSD